MGMRFNLSRWKTKLQRGLGLPEATALLDYDKRKIRIGVSSAMEYHTRIHSCKKEPETIEWIESFSPGDVFYDVGANVGAYSLVAAAFWEGVVRVVAFEPAAVNFARLVHNLTLNGLESFVTPLPIALGKKTALSTFHYANLEAGGSLHVLNSTRDYRNAEFKPRMSCPTLVYELDSLTKLFGLPPPTHLKLDVDGTEWEILQGASRTLLGVRSILVEMDAAHPQTPQIRSLLKEQGFEEESQHPYRYAKLFPQFSGISNVIFTRSNAGISSCR